MLLRAVATYFQFSMANIISQKITAAETIIYALQAAHFIGTKCNTDQSKLISRHVQPTHYLSQLWLVGRFARFFCG
jgi:hypothetical protein